MAMQLRIEYAGACYHVINRGNYRRNLFAERKSGEAFERTLGEAATRYGWRVHAYVVMRNHFHLAVELTEPNLSEGMRWLQATWVRRYNGFRRLVGKPFQGRYKAQLTERGKALAQVCHYIHLNPVRAGAPPFVEIGSFALSSLNKFLSKKRPNWLEGSFLLHETLGLQDNRQGWGAYADHLEFLSGDEEAKRELTAKNLSRGWCVGGKDFRKEMRQEAKQKGADLERQRFEGILLDEMKTEKEHLWEERLQRLAVAAKANLEKLGSRKSAPSKVLLAAALRQSTSAQNAWIATRLAMGKPASVSQFTKRYLSTTSGKKAVERVLSKVKH